MFGGGAVFESVAGDGALERIADVDDVGDVGFAVVQAHHGSREPQDGALFGDEGTAARAGTEAYGAAAGEDLHRLA